MTQARGWHSRGYLPHFDSPETIQFVTFRLADSLPRAVIEALRAHADAVQRIDHELDRAFTSRRANVQLGRSGPFWHADYFDRYIRGEGHLARTIDYVEQNPVKAGLASVASEWFWSSARLRSTESDMSGPGGPRSA